MPAKAGIQDFEKLNKIKNWIPAFAGMTALFPITAHPLEGEGEGGGIFACQNFKTSKESSTE